jgi:hypothetical protein
MARQATKTKRKATVLRVPDLEDDAAERKRTLNVLAQRRYRERKREHLKKLESQIDSSATPLPATAASETPEAGQNQPTYLPSDIDSTGDSLYPLELPGLRFDGRDEVADELENPLSVNDGWADPFESSVHTWPAATLLPSLFPSSKMTSSGTTLASDQTTDASTSPSSLGGADGPTSYQGMDITSALQTTSTKSYTFPDERHTDILELKLLRGCMMIAKRMNIEDLLWSLDSMSPFTDPALSGLSFDHLPVNLRPTPTQQRIPHHPMLDILVWPVVRDKLILVFSQPVEERPPIAASPTALLDLVYDIEDSAEGVRIWGDDPYDAENWETGEAVFKKWWWAIDSSIIGKSNKLRMERGAPLLGAGEGFVMGEI